MQFFFSVILFFFLGTFGEAPVPGRPSSLNGRCAALTVSHYFTVCVQSAPPRALLCHEARLPAQVRAVTAVHAPETHLRRVVLDSRGRVRPSVVVYALWPSRSLLPAANRARARRTPRDQSVPRRACLGSGCRMVSDPGSLRAHHQCHCRKYFPMVAFPYLFSLRVSYCALPLRLLLFA